jgi:hypothetical protein
MMLSAERARIIAINHGYQTESELLLDRIAQEIFIAANKGRVSVDIRCDIQSSAGSQVLNNIEAAGYDVEIWYESSDLDARDPGGPSITIRW